MCVGGVLVHCLCVVVVCVVVCGDVSLLFCVVVVCWWGVSPLFYVVVVCVLVGMLVHCFVL